MNLIDTLVLILLLQTKCPLGLQFLNPNKASEMAQIMKNIQSHYVPTESGDDAAEVDHNIIQKVIFDGDQLTEERARNCQWANTLADNETDRLNGITTAFADWHLNKLLLGVIIKLLFIKFSLPLFLYKEMICIFWKSLILFKPLICPTDLHEAIFQGQLCS